MTELDALIDRARMVTVDREAAERYVRELDRWARPVPPAPRRWTSWLTASMAATAAVGFLVLWLSGRAPAEARTPVWLGDRVAIVAEPESVYRIAWAGGDDTQVVIERGAVTARLWPGTHRHRLSLTCLGVTATATGTVYSLALRAEGPVVHVIEGAVEVRTSEELHIVHAGATWPAAGATADPAGGRILLALNAPALASDAPARVDAGAVPSSDADNTAVVVASGAAARDAQGAAPGPRQGSGNASVSPPPPTPPAETTTIKDRWHAARLLRGQGKFAAALAECLAIADAGDPTWSPIALVEAVRIDLEPLADPEGAILLADRMIREWPGDVLATEARELRCRALRQLGRGDECGSAKAP